MFIPLFNREADRELPYFAEIDVDKLRSEDNFDKKIKRRQELDDKSRWLNIIGLVREYYILLSELHDELRNITSGILNDSINTIHSIIEKYYVYEKIPAFAFECSEARESFLLQMTYISSLEQRRNKKYGINKDSFYAGKTVFKYSDAVSCRNAVKLKILYNQS